MAASQVQADKQATNCCSLGETAAVQQRSFEQGSFDQGSFDQGSPETLISCENASFAYAGKEVLSDLNFVLHRGDYLCIVGPNGSGKSTLVRGLLRLMTPAAGKLDFASRARPSQIGYLPQRVEVSRDFPASVREVVLSGCLGRRGLKPFYSRRDRAACARSLALLQADDLAHRNFGELSGGQQQRVLLARALCATDSLLVLDEPAAGLDLALQAELEQIITRLNVEQGVTVVMVSHDLESALKYANMILHLDGVQRFFGTTEAYRCSGVGDGFIGCSHNAVSRKANKAASDKQVIEQIFADGGSDA